MTPQQIELARHALGLPNKRKWSYRNHFIAGPGHSDYVDWMAMVEAGHAKRYDGAKAPFGGDDCFTLTLGGAMLAIKPGEHLDPEDFPKQTAA